jgi:hypothetical protein
LKKKIEKKKNKTGHYINQSFNKSEPIKPPDQMNLPGRVSRLNRKRVHAEYGKIFLETKQE